MILGIGIDLVDIRRIEKALSRFGSDFEKRVFTPLEQKTARSRKKAGSRVVAATYAKRFAAKEACIKALGKEGIGWLDMEVTNLKNGAPVLTLHGAAKKRLAAITPPKRRAILMLTMADAYPFAQAQVVITAERK